jgi:hypothetical protein
MTLAKSDIAIHFSSHTKSPPNSHPLCCYSIIFGRDEVLTTEGEICLWSPMWMLQMIALI